MDAHAVTGKILADACRWYAFRVADVDETSERITMTAQVVDCGTIREFFGFNRAKHAVLEAAILATRVNFLPHDEILAQLEQLASPVAKTAGPQETEAFKLLQNYIQSATTAGSA